MSYCRWSSQNFQCDIYCYEHCDGGIMIHVAANRIEKPLPDMPPMNRETLTDGSWLEAHNRNMEILDGMNHVPIGLQYDGQSFHVGEFDMAAELLIRLRDIGYNVPDYAIECLQEEAQLCEAEE